MARLSATDELRKEVWDALVKAKGDREKAAALLGKSERTLNRYIHDLNLFADMDKAGMIKHAGPPRNAERGESRRQEVIFKHIKKNKGQVDYGELATDLYGDDTPKTRQRVYIAMNELKGKGEVGDDGDKWFII
jgi:hypothetical protein